MRPDRSLILAILLPLAACIEIPLGGTVPEPKGIQVRATVFAACVPEGGCGSQLPTGHYRGSLVFAEADSVVMFNVQSAQRVTVRAGAGVLLEVYRGQRRTPDAVATSAGTGFLVGVLGGAGTGLFNGLLLGSSDLDVGRSVAGSALLGGIYGVVAGAAVGYNQGESVWERVTVLQLRQELCHCSDPDGPRKSAISSTP